MKKIAYAVAACALLSACDRGQQSDQPQTYNQEQQPQHQMTPAPMPQQDSAPVASPHAHADWQGDWFGVEGTYINITPSSPGNYNIEMQYDLDNLVTVKGIDEGDAIAFQRNDLTFKLRPSEGDQIGLNGLDGRKTCLKVQDGEGYCRQ